MSRLEARPGCRLARGRGGAGLKPCTRAKDTRPAENRRYKCQYRPPNSGDEKLWDIDYISNFKIIVKNRKNKNVGIVPTKESHKYCMINMTAI